jgi:hypothetical protein
MRKLLWFLALAFPMAGAVDNPRVLGVTPTQAVIAYTAPSSSACTLEVSESASYTPLVHDVNTALFASSNADSRSGNVSTGRSRTFVVGQRRTDKAASGRWYSRALKADTVHYFRVTCGVDTATGTFRTANVPFGATRMDNFQPDTERLGQHRWPSTPKYGEEIIDPHTGTALKDLTKRGWVYANSTSAGAFSTASGANWTNPSSALADDAAYATYTGSGQDWLAVTGWTYPDSSSVSLNQLAFINLYVKGYCTGANCTTGGQTMQVCLTRDGANCEDPIREFDLPATEGSSLISDSGSADQPGDWFSFELTPKDDWKLGDGMVYNTSADYTKIKFTNAADCNRLQTGETLRVYRDIYVSTATFTINSLNCAAPEAVISASTQLDYNGASGMPFEYAYGAKGNKRFGFLIRKKNAGTAATPTLNYVYVKAASSGLTRLAGGAGGFEQTCSKTKTANGYYHCKIDYSLLGVKTEDNGDLTVKFLGMSVVWMTGQGINSGSYWCDLQFDTSDANVMYCPASSSYNTNRGVLVKLTYTGGDKECGESGSSCSAAIPYGTEGERWPRAPFTYTNLTPCLNSCTDPATEDYSLDQQMIRYTASKSYQYSETTFPSCGISAVQGTHAVGMCASGQQDSYMWMFAFDLGNKSAIGSGYTGTHGNTQQIMGAVPMFNRTHSRWCTHHTYQNPMYDGIAVPEMQIEKIYPFQVTLNTALSACSKAGSGNCSACPSVTVDGYDYTGKNWCAIIGVTSSWNGAWGTAPPGYAAGDPLSGWPTPPYHWLRAAEVGDVFTHGNEYLKILQKNSSTQWVVERGFGFDQSWQYPKAHDSGVSLNAHCATTTSTTTAPGPEVLSGVNWHYLDDPDGTGVGTTYYMTEYINHAFSRPNVRATPKFSVSLADFSDAAALRDGNASHASIDSVVKFGGKHSENEGNMTETHPSYNQYDAPARDQVWFLDVHPWLFSSNNTNAPAVNVTGDLWRFAEKASWGDGFQYKYFDLLGSIGWNQLRDVSGPGVTLGGTSADAYKMCYVHRAGECYAGSTVGQIYFNAPTIDQTWKKCKEVEFIPGGIRDVCITEFNAIDSSLTQWGLPRTNGETMRNLERSRVLARVFFRYRQSTTENAKPAPDGRWALSRFVWAYRLPPYPPEDTVNRAEFVKVPVTLKPPAGVDNVLVEFGYDTSFRCTLRNEACMKDGNATEPYVFAGDTLTGISCGTGCTVEIPGISGRVLYWRVKYRSNNGLVVAQSGTNVTAP